MIALPIKSAKSNQDIKINKMIELRGIGKKYSIGFEDIWALKEVSLDICQGSILGIIGRNGSGKTTLLNIIAEVLYPTQGEVFVNGRVLKLFNLGIGFQDELTGKENVFLNAAIFGVTKREIDNKLSLIIGFSELGDFINMPLGTYSQGMRLRLAFSIIANLDFDILAMDEVLAVGDALFQSKCFQRLMDFKRSGKTLVITTQSMDLIERLCDKVALLDHGHLLFHGDTLEGINKYRALLNSEKFFVGPVKKNTDLVENTKRWSDDKSEWGKKLGTKEVEIERVTLINKWGLKCEKVNSGDPLKIKVHFAAKNSVKEPHFGVAIFRKDGVYCYGPNTAFDGQRIAGLKQGKGWFSLHCKKIFLAPGEYFLSVAIWDKNETLAFDYHKGFYKLTVVGYKNEKGDLLNLPFKLKLDSSNTINSGLEPSLKLLNSQGEEKDVFITNEPVKVVLNFSDSIMQNNDSQVDLNIFRDDGVCCQGITIPIGRSKGFNILFPKFALLPGRYKISTGKAVYCFRMVFNRQDHGTIYLEHRWHWR